MTAKPAFEPALRALAARERRALDDHPTPETLGDYRAGKLPAEEQEALRDHLALCPDCAEMLLDFATFEQFTPPEEPAGLTDGDVGAAWQRMQQRLAPGGAVDRVETPEAAPVVAQEKKPEPLPFVPRVPEYERVVLRRRLRTAYAIAATLAVGVVGLSVWGVALYRKVTEPRSNLAMVNAQPESEVTRSGDDKSTVVPAGAEYVLLFLYPKEDSYPTYEVKVRAASSTGSPIIARSGLILDGLTLSIEFSRSLLAPGKYQVDLYGLDGKRRIPLTPLFFEVASP